MNIKVDQALKEKILIWFVAFFAVFFLFYWTHMLFASRANSYTQRQKSYTEQIAKTAELISEVSSGANSTKRVESGLLSFIQNTAARTGIAGRILDLKPVSNASGAEVVSLRIQALNLNELNSFLGLVEGYQNLTIKNFSLKKRFDDPTLADITLELVKNR
ncbi:MAG: hypothetical protein LRY50_01275 [Geovibrio sp.]|jgi:uncharacterized membrane protein YeiB|uniref:hypothetical protein n=1 Tax=Geovibrio ferrireducens TaxID=46201 RepID=UPI002245AF38|nr:hypothetical protein [Geovibrio ferrireducens]MCD8492482.1 hypothetical protein [Geovibrio sp.]MCD8567038.1 hypothetical protein [Geovibrio sp.]